MYAPAFSPSVSPLQSKMSNPYELTPSPSDTLPPSPSGGALDPDAGPVVVCGQYLTRCVNPFLSVDVLIAVAQEQMDMGSEDQGLYM